MKKMINIREFINQLNGGEDIKFSLNDFPGFDGTEEITKEPIFEDESIRIWYFEDNDSDGFIRDDSVGLSFVFRNLSRDDQLKLAAWNCDLDIRKLNLRADDLELALKDAQENEWGVIK